MDKACFRIKLFTFIVDVVQYTLNQAMFAVKCILRMVHYVGIQTQGYIDNITVILINEMYSFISIHFHKWINKRLSEENKVPRKQLNARKLAAQEGAGNIIKLKKWMRVCRPVGTVCLLILFSDKKNQSIKGFLCWLKYLPPKLNHHQDTLRGKNDFNQIFRHSEEPCGTRSVFRLFIETK